MARLGHITCDGGGGGILTVTGGILTMAGGILTMAGGILTVTGDNG